MVVDFEEPVEGPAGRDPGLLSLAVLTVWSHFFKSNTQWPFINLMGQGLEQYRNMILYQKQHVSQRGAAR